MSASHDSTAHREFGSCSWERGATLVVAGCACGWSERVADPAHYEDAWRRHLNPLGLLTREQRMAARDVVHVFSNGTEYMDWSDRNCGRCAKGYDDEAHDWRCPLEKAIGEAMFDADAGMDRELALRAGLASWPRKEQCPEFERDWRSR